MLRWKIVLIGLALLVGEPWGRAGPRKTYLLLPDALPEGSPYVAIWKQAAEEEGFFLETLTVSELLGPDFQAVSEGAGIVVPDTIDVRAENALTDRLKDFARSGGKLMLVYDAATQDPAGIYPPHCRLREAAGVDYALYATLREASIRQAPAIFDDSALHRLRLPPGACSAPDWERQGRAGAETEHQLCAYRQPAHLFPHFATEGAFDGIRLAKDPDGNLLAGVHSFGRGSVLFVNLPLGYLKLRTDGMLLHAFLGYFAERMLGLPRLLGVPGGVGGLVLNLHIDSNAAILPLETLKTLGFWKQGPYSVHITAGPDTRQPGDHLGFDVEHDKKAREWAKFFASRGDAVGSHGGWIHDFFGKNVSDRNAAEFTHYLELNRQELEKATGRRVTEYSAPVGNHPYWVTEWLERAGFKAYYFTGNMGLGPTRSFRPDTGSSGEPYGEDRRIWSFPVNGYCEITSLEEAQQKGMPDGPIAGWLESMARFAVTNRLARLVYFHPPGLAQYPAALQSWLRLTDELSRRGTFRWYTMSGLADFLERRTQTRFEETLASRRGAGKQVVWARMEASNPESLDGETLSLLKTNYSRPRLIAGKGQVQEDETSWLVTMSEGNHVELEARKLR